MKEEMPTLKKKMGFALMAPERQREIAARGGRSVKPENRSFSRDQALAKRAGRMGGFASAKGNA